MLLSLNVRDVQPEYDFDQLVRYTDYGIDTL